LDLNDGVEILKRNAASNIIQLLMHIINNLVCNFKHPMVKRFSNCREIFAIPYIQISYLIKFVRN